MPCVSCRWRRGRGAASDCAEEARSGAAMGRSQRHRYGDACGRSESIMTKPPSSIASVKRQPSCEGSPAKLEYAHALVDLGAAHRRANRRAEARGILEKGLKLARRCGADALPSGRMWSCAPPEAGRAIRPKAGTAADGLRAPGRGARRQGTQQSTDRAGALRHAQDGRDPPGPHLLQARDCWTSRAGPRTRATSRRLTRRSPATPTVRNQGEKSGSSPTRSPARRGHHPALTDAA